MNMKKTWNLLRSVIDKQKNKAMLPEIFVINNHEISNKKEIANKFNEFFARVGDEIISNVSESEQHFTNYLSAPNPQSMYLDPTSPFDIINITSKIKTRNSQDANDISTKIMKNSIENVALPISHIINLTFLTGIVPKELKIAKVIPIFKSGNSSSFNNYRPISILPVFSKILGGRRSPAIACWASDHWVASSNPLRGKFRH